LTYGFRESSLIGKIKNIIWYSKNYWNSEG